jgi:hypothetical protein
MNSINLEQQYKKVSALLTLSRGTAVRVMNAAEVKQAFMNYRLNLTENLWRDEKAKFQNMDTSQHQNLGLPEGTALFEGPELEKGTKLLMFQRDVLVAIEQIEAAEVPATIFSLWQLQSLLVEATKFASTEAIQDQMLKAQRHIEESYPTLKVVWFDPELCSDEWQLVFGKKAVAVNVLIEGVRCWSQSRKSDSRKESTTL